ncbi:hypothetical protein Bhyg_08052 [Pseudolycoriella hygida]|uniref:Uncharacterized protein n=1 Tax=Pseudolycoriella hygida TaxID=35572 RepID=A0A9Q0N453_9DIPT|nr:hypothetical protein Bhyg_08052 [Pseudolycoriella hygida]
MHNLKAVPPNFTFHERNIPLQVLEPYFFVYLNISANCEYEVEMPRIYKRNDLPKSGKKTQNQLFDFVSSLYTTNQY